MSKPTAKMYFTRGFEVMAQDLAAQVRNEGNLVNLIYAGLFREPADCQKCDAVLIQATAGKAETIATCYKALDNPPEIHFFDDEGEFVDGPSNTESAKPAEEPAAEEPAAEAPRDEPSGSDAGEPEQPATEEKPVSETGDAEADSSAEDSGSDGGGSEAPASEPAKPKAAPKKATRKRAASKKKSTTKSK